MSLEAEFDGDIARLEFKHGKANEMGRAELDALAALCDELVDRGTRALISYSRRLSRRGTPSFIAGANVTERIGWNDERITAHVRAQRAVLARLRALPLLHVTVVNGVALGWGTEWLITADYRVATPQARFGLPETSLGIVPGAGGTSELWSLIGLPQALRLGMTGEQIDAHEAARIGLVQEVVPDVDAGLVRALALAHATAKRSPTAVAAFKTGALASVGRPAAARQAIEARAYEHCLATGEAAIGRSNFKTIIAGDGAPWGDLHLLEPEA
ncbi:MAG: enoyl-CoA hydratase/isomerase family protein [Myxococcales bacterium]|nr:enoyl-CoA hydratase/isomerase family protein [Myxococcales bacterium]